LCFTLFLAIVEEPARIVVYPCYKGDVIVEEGLRECLVDPVQHSLHSVFVVGEKHRVERPLTSDTDKPSRVVSHDIDESFLELRRPILELEENPIAPATERIMIENSHVVFDHSVFEPLDPVPNAFL
jgi:hypothetical protein